jgi:hypothetical protein
MRIRIAECYDDMWPYMKNAITLPIKELDEVFKRMGYDIEVTGKAKRMLVIRDLAHQIGGDTIQIVPKNDKNKPYYGKKVKFPKF